MGRLVKLSGLDRLGDLTLELLTGAAFAASVLGAGLATLISIPPPVSMSGLVILTLFYVLAARAKDFGKIHKFNEGTMEEISFFENWYRRTGRHRIYTNDLSWLRRGNSRIIGEILSRPRDFHIAYRHVYSDSRDDYENMSKANVRLTKLTDSPETHLRFSIWERDGYSWVIVRDKGRERTSSEIVFRETDEHYTVTFAEGFFTTSCALAGGDNAS